MTGTDPVAAGGRSQRDISRGRLMAMTLTPIAVILVIILGLSIATNTERAIATSIINDILDFSKIEAGKLDMESVDFDLARMLDTLSHLVGLKSGEKGLELIIGLDPEVPLSLKGDPLRLNQILINLTSALTHEHMPDGGYAINLGITPR